MTDKKIANLHDILATGTKKVTSAASKNKSNSITTSSNKDHEFPITKKEKNMGGRTPKNQKYAQERKTVLDNLLKILELTSESNIFYVCDLENNDKKKKQLDDLVEDIKQYFSYGTWTFFAKTDIPFPYTTLVRAIFRDMDVKFDSVSIRNNKTNKIYKQGYLIYL